MPCVNLLHDPSYTERARTLGAGIARSNALHTINQTVNACGTGHKRPSSNSELSSSTPFIPTHVLPVSFLPMSSAIFSNRLTLAFFHSCPEALSCQNIKLEIV